MNDDTGTLAPATRIREIENNIGRVFLGKPEAVRMVVVGLLAGGHVLIEDLPGVGKTVLASALARSIDVSFKRIQFTADLLPADIIGVSIYDANRGDFVFKRGPVFASIVLADEINRSTPRTQSSLLEAMNELHVSADGVTHELPRPFMVLATQNAFEAEGAFPLPDSEMDRFFVRINIGYPPHEQEMEILRRQLTPRSVDALKPVVTAEEVLELQELVSAVTFESSVLGYLLDIVKRTRQSQEVEIGVSPRGALMFSRGCRALALAEDRDYCIPDDVKRLAKPALLHRLVPRGGHRARSGRDRAEVEQILEDILHDTPVPV